MRSKPSISYSDMIKAVLISEIGHCLDQGLGSDRVTVKIDSFDRVKLMRMVEEDCHQALQMNLQPVMCAMIVLIAV